MRRTTICRSSGSPVAALIAVALWSASLSAQQPPVPQRPASQPAAAPAPEAQQAVPQAAQAQRPGPPPATHIVAQGETLWGLAQQFLGDPLLWPEIYRLNTDVVEDPHWIFPGEELRFVAVDAPAQGNVAITPTADSVRGAQPVVQQAPPATIFTAQEAAPAAQQAAVRVAAERAYRAVREGEYFASGFVADVSTLPTGTVIGPVENSAISRLSARGSANLYGSVTVRPPRDEGFLRGDLLLAFIVDRNIRGFGDVVVPSGLLRVETAAPAGQNAQATAIALYGPVNSGQRFIKIPPFPSQASARPVPVEGGMTAQVIETQLGRELVSVQAVIYLDRGADEGVRLGDMFRVTMAADATAGTAARDQAEVMVVHVRPHTATCVVTSVSQPNVRPGATARLVRRVPS